MSLQITYYELMVSIHNLTLVYRCLYFFNISWNLMTNAIGLCIYHYDFDLLIRKLLKANLYNFLKKKMYFKSKQKDVFQIKTKRCISNQNKIYCHLLSTINSPLTLSWRRPLWYRNQSIDFLCKSMDWFLYDNSVRHERVNSFSDGCQCSIH